MGYFDGNTVTALWNYAQHFALSDNSFATMSGQSTRGALNLTAGDTFGVLCGPPTSVFGDVPECGPPASSTATPAPTNGQLGTFVDDTDPYWDVCSEGSPAALTGRNIGDLLTAAGVTWGWFQGGFARTRDGGLLEQPSARGLRPRGRGRSRHRSPAVPGLRAASQSVPVLCLHRQSAPSAADVGGHGRQDRSGQPPLRPHAGSGRPPGPAISPPSRSSRHRPTRTDTPATPIRSTSRSSWSPS